GNRVLQLGEGGLENATHHNLTRAKCRLPTPSGGGNLRMHTASRCRATVCRDGTLGPPKRHRSPRRACGPTLVHARIQPGSMDKLGRPTVTTEQAARRFQSFLTSG